MIIDSIYRDKNKDFSFKNETVQTLFYELDKLSNRHSSLSNFNKFLFECKATDILQQFVDFCNNNVFWSFKLELKMV